MKINQFNPFGHSDLDIIGAARDEEANYIKTMLILLEDERDKLRQMLQGPAGQSRAELEKERGKRFQNLERAWRMMSRHWPKRPSVRMLGEKIEHEKLMAKALLDNPPPPTNNGGGRPQGRGGNGGRSGNGSRSGDSGRGVNSGRAGSDSRAPSSSKKGGDRKDSGLSAADHQRATNTMTQAFFKFHQEQDQDQNQDAVAPVIPDTPVTPVSTGNASVEQVRGEVLVSLTKTLNEDCKRLLLGTNKVYEDMQKNLGAQAAKINTKKELESFQKRWDYALQALESLGTDNRSSAFKMLLKTDYLAIHQAGPLLSRQESSRCWNQANKFLNQECPKRSSEIQRLLSAVLRRLAGDPNATFPILHGPPGTGKSHIAGMVAEALTKAGIQTGKVDCRLSNHDGDSTGNDGFRFVIFGSDAHYNNGNCGQLYNTLSGAGMNNLVLCLIDEAEKAPQSSNMLINILDPTQPLQDTFLAHFFPEHNLRDRSVFVLSANNLELLGDQDSPLRSRLQPIYYREYDEQEVIELAARLSRRTLAPIYDLPEERFLALAQLAVLKLGKRASFRAVLNMVGEMTFLEGALSQKAEALMQDPHSPLFNAGRAHRKSVKLGFM